MSTVRYNHDALTKGTVKLLLGAINKGSKPAPTGGVQYVDSDLHQYFFLLTDAFEYPPDLNRTDMASLVRRECIRIRTRDELIDQKRLLVAVNEAAKGLRRRTPVLFTMWTLLRFRSTPSAKGFKLRVGDVSIEGTRHLSKWLRLKPYFLSGHGAIDPNEIPFFCYLIARCHARTENEAADKIFRSCDLFNAVVNLRWRFTELWVQRKPQAILWLGPFQFFFRKHSFIGKDHIWFNSSFDEQDWKRFPKELSDFHKRLAGVRRSIAALNDHPLEGVLRRTMLLLSEGMSSPDLAFRLMRYWAALETLYGERSSGHTPSTRLIDRATFPETDPALSALKLRRLSDLRNKYVHEGSTEGDNNDLVQFLREMLCQHVLYLLHNGRDFKNHAEYLAMADLPGNAADLAARKIAIERRERIMTSGKHTN